MEDEEFFLVILKLNEESMSNENNHQQAQMLRGTAWLTASNFISQSTRGYLYYPLVYLDGVLCGYSKWSLHHGL